MRTLTVIVLSVTCLMPLCAQDLSERDIVIGFELEDKIIKAYFDDDIFQFEWLYNTRNGFTDDLFFSWPLAQDVRKRIAFVARPEMWESDASRRMGNKPDRAGKYFAGLQYFSERVDLRLLHPLVYEVEGEKLHAFAELKHLHLFNLPADVKVFSRGWTDFHTGTFSLGASKEFGSLELKGFLNDFKDFSWSVGYSTSIN